MLRCAQLLGAVGILLLVAAGALELHDLEPDAAATSSAAPSTSTTTSSPAPQPSPDAPSTRSTAPAPSSTSSTPTPTRAPRPTASASSPEQGRGEAVAVPARAERDRAIARARAFLTDLYATARTPAQWRAALGPRLTPQAVADMSAMEPSWVEPEKLGRGGAVVVQPLEGEDAHRALETEVRIPLRGGGHAAVFLRPDLRVSRYTLGGPDER